MADDTPTRKLTIAEFAARVKQREPRLASVPDEELVRKILEVRPDMRDYLVTSEPRRPLAQEPDFMQRAGRRFQESIAGIPRSISDIIQQSAQEGTAARKRGDWGALAMAPVHALQTGEGGFLTSLYNVSTPGLVERVAAREDPANIAADMALMMLPAESRPTEMAAEALRRGVRGPVGMVAQELAGAGREPVLKARMAYEDAIRDWRQATGAKQAEYAAKVREAEQAYQRAARLQIGKKQASQSLQAYGERLRGNLQETFQRVKSRLDSRWDSLRNTPAPGKAAPEGAAPSSVEDRILQVLRKEGRPGLTVSLQRLAQAPELRGVSPEELQKAAVRLRNSAKVWGHEARAAGEAKESIYGIAWRGEPGGKLTILSDEPLNSTELADAVREAQDRYLQGQPQQIAVFRNLLKFMEEPESTGAGPPGGAAGGAAGARPPELIDQPGGPPAKRYQPITWDEGRRQYSALGDAEYSREVNPYVRRAIEYVRKNARSASGRDISLGGQLKAKAEAFGALPAYESLLKDWSQYESDWLDMSSVTRRGGSPLAIASKAPNAATLIPQVTGKTGDLLVKRLKNYSNAGASVGLAEAIQRLDTQIKELPKSVKVPSAFEQPSLPKYPPLPEPVDPATLRRGKLLDYSGRRLGWWERMFPPILAERAIFKRPSFREMVATMPRAELPLPGELRRPPLERGPSAIQRPLGPELLLPLQTPSQAGNARQIELVRNLQALYERQRAANDPQAMTTGLKLKQERDKLFPQAPGP